MNDFYAQVAERKSAARSAFHRKCGSKSRKCTLPHESMTPKQLRERNGEIVSVSFEHPADWDTFKKLSQQSQTEYLLGLVHTYGANYNSFAKMFGVAYNTLRSYLEKRGIDLGLSVGRTMSTSQREAWERFLADEDSGEQITVNGSTLPRRDRFPTRAKMQMSQFTVVFQGDIDPYAVANSLRGILGEGARGKVVLTCCFEQPPDSFVPRPAALAPTDAACYNGEAVPEHG